MTFNVFIVFFYFCTSLSFTQTDFPFNQLFSKWILTFLYLSIIVLAIFSSISLKLRRVRTIARNLIFMYIRVLKFDILYFLGLRKPIRALKILVIMLLRINLIFFVFSFLDIKLTSCIELILLIILIISIWNSISVILITYFLKLVWLSLSIMLRIFLAMGV